MVQKPKDVDIARQVEMTIHGLDSLEILPQVAAALLPNLTDRYLDKHALTEIIKTAPTLTAKVFELAFNNGVNLVDNESPIEHAVQKLPWHILRDALISLKVSQYFTLSLYLSKIVSQYFMKYPIHSRPSQPLHFSTNAYGIS